jgi:hypothetical protein
MEHPHHLALTIHVNQECFVNGHKLCHKGLQVEDSFRACADAMFLCKNANKHTMKPNKKLNLHKVRQRV